MVPHIVLLLGGAIILYRCGHCQALVPEYKKLAKATKGIIKVGAVNADDHKSLGGRYGVSGFPTIKIFGADKKKPMDYQGRWSMVGGGRVTHRFDRREEGGVDRLQGHFGGKGCH